MNCTLPSSLRLRQIVAFYRNCLTLALCRHSSSRECESASRDGERVDGVRGEQLPCLRVLRVGAQPVHRQVLDQPATGEYRDPVSEAFQHVQVVRHHEGAHLVVGYHG